jgi:translocation and assembly module TamA
MVVLPRCHVALLGGVLCLMAVVPLRAQVNSPTTLDPESPMAPMPGIGVDWPDMTDSLAETKAAPSTDISADRRYAIVVDGLEKVDRAKIMSRFNLLSVLRTGEGKPSNVAQVNRRAHEDADLLENLLRAEGYYDVNIETTVEPGEAQLLTVRLTVEPGVLYHFGDVQVSGLEAAGPKAESLRGTFGVGAEDPVNADAVLGGQEALTTRFSREGYPFAVVGAPEVIVDHDTQTATLEMKVSPGGERRFGRIIVSGTKPPFGASHVARIERFKTGEPFNQVQVDDLKRAIIATGLVSSVVLKPVQGESAGTADLNVALEPAPMRTIAGEFGYGTGEGVRAEVSWTHRNLIHPEGAVTFRGVGGTREQYLGAILRQSNFRRRDQVFNASIAASNLDQPAFKARSFAISAGIERQSNIIWQKKWTWSIGGELIASSERNGVQPKQTYFIGALPLVLSYDGSDDLLDPRKGYRLSMRFSPELSLQSGTFGYLRTQVDGSAYLPAGKKLVLAGRVRLGSILGAGATQIAPSRRAYSGGGGSVRGYSYQSIGPRDALGDPIGGRSLAEFALEARVRMGTIGIVPFLDGGSISSATLPNLSDFRFGAGLGFRYHSSFGPIRVDVGTPIKRRAGDPLVTVSVSLGQAF